MSAYEHTYKHTYTRSVHTFIHIGFPSPLLNVRSFHFMPLSRIYSSTPLYIRTHTHTHTHTEERLAAVTFCPRGSKAVWGQRVIGARVESSMGAESPPPHTVFDPSHHHFDHPKCLLKLNKKPIFLN